MTSLIILSLRIRNTLCLTAEAMNEALYFVYGSILVSVVLAYAIEQFVKPCRPTTVDRVPC